ncbi:MAG: hypothetical protein ACRDSR_25845 [Pseudonocardiaceae bacterium]
MAGLGERAVAVEETCPAESSGSVIGCRVAGVAYRCDGTPGLIVIEKVGLVRLIPPRVALPRGLGWPPWFLYDVAVTLPEPGGQRAVGSSS